MDTTPEPDLQQQEITALQSIYANDFIESPPPKAWKGAARLPEFTVRVTYPVEPYAEKVLFHLNVKLPRTYPLGTYPIFTIKPPIVGIKPQEMSKLTHAIHEKAQTRKGEQMVFEIICFAREWMEAHITPPIETSGSLATEMNRRAEEEERAKKQREDEEAALNEKRQAEYAEKLNRQIQEDFHRQQLERERFQKARQRAMSDATEVPPSEDAIPSETFDREIKWQGHSFRRVRLFQPRQECLGTVFQADPILDEPLMTLPLELLSITFHSHYYTTTQGRKKLKQVESELQRLAGIRHRNLLSVLAANLTTPNANTHPRLLVLTEKRPPVTLHDVLEDTDHLREDRATEYLTQILSALQVVHNNDIVHRGINLKCVGLASSDEAHSSKVVKLFNIGYPVRLLDLHRSDPFIMRNGGFKLDEEDVPDGWLPPVESKLDYTKGRDIHSAGIVLLQMLLGRNMMQNFPDPQRAIHLSTITPFLSTKAAVMLAPVKKGGVSCQTLLMDLTSPTYSSAHNRTPTIPHAGPKTPTVNGFAVGSPETDYFRMPPPLAKHTSRWKEDWEELEILGRGGFGEVVKARNTVDNRIYAVKKIKLRDVQNDKIFREVSALSRLNHRFIVRYYTTWVETSAAPLGPSVGSGEGSEDSELTEASYEVTADVTHLTSRRQTSMETLEERFTTFDLRDIDSNLLHELDSNMSRTNSTFPSIHFTRTGSQDNGDDSDAIEEEDEDEEDDIFDWPADKLPEAHAIMRKTSPIMINAQGKKPGNHWRQALPKLIPRRILYIQMEFVERQTLRERIAEGLDEDEAWRLFHQILDALVHMSSLGIIHRDIKLTNIFVDAKGDCKVGDFGLATESMDAVDPSDKITSRVDHQDITLDVGTKLYMAPEMIGSEFSPIGARGGKKPSKKLKVPKEVKGGKATPRNNTKADMYSLGIVFFEMNYFFKTDSERHKVLPDLRRPTIDFPKDWDAKRTTQKKIIEWLLKHDPDERPSAIQLSQSPLLPPRVEDEYVMGALNMIAQADSPHLPTVLSALFKQPVKDHRAIIYDGGEIPEHITLNSLVIDHLEQIFHLHGAIDTEAPLLMPVTNPVEDDHNRAVYLDRQGEVVSLPHNALPPFARAAARAAYDRIKRYHICDIYRPNVTGGHPLTSKVAVYDIITPDITFGPAAAAAEGIAIFNQCLDLFGDLSQHYHILLSHSSILDIAMQRVPSELRAETEALMTGTKSSTPQKRNNLKLKGVSRVIIDELEALSSSYDSIDALVERLEKVSPALLENLDKCIKEMACTIQFAKASGAARPVIIEPLLWDNRSTYFANGVCFMAVRKNKPTDVLGVGGRYDHLIRRYANPSAPPLPSRAAFGFQIYLEKITANLAPYQNNFIESQMLLKEPKSFGYWIPRRCDVYVVSYTGGQLAERLETTAMLWRNNISADLMYESAFVNGELKEDYYQLCQAEGILFMVHLKTRPGLSTVYKVKTMLSGAETEVQSQDLVSYLQNSIAEQKRYDASLSGIQPAAETSQAQAPERSHADQVLVLPNDTNKKTRKATKTLHMNKAYDSASALKSAMPGFRIVAVEVPTSVFDEMAKNATWLVSEEPLRAMAALLQTHQSGYPQQVRDAILRIKTDRERYVLLYGIRQDRIALLPLG